MDTITGTGTGNNLPSNYVCWDCGTPYLTDRQKDQGGAVTSHQAACGLCGKMKQVTHIRHWNYLIKIAPSSTGTTKIKTVK